MIRSEKWNSGFNEKDLQRLYRKHKINKEDLKTQDNLLEYKNFVITKSETITEGLIQHYSYYYILNPDDTTSIIWFSSINDTNKDFERQFCKSIIEKRIPDQCFTPLVIDSLNFAGRKIKLGSYCRWMDVNNVQWPYNGQMNWSLHKDLAYAKSATENQLLITKSRKSGKVLSEQIVDVIFENEPTKALKIIYDFTGISSALASLSGGKTLTVFYITSEVRNYNISCVLSFWNNDDISTSGLPLLLEQVMSSN